MGVEKLYIDHTASPDFGGYVIVTKENAVKSVTGWSRFQFSLKPLEEITFHVTEEVVYSSEISSQTELLNLISENSVVKEGEYCIDAKTREQILQLVKVKYLNSCLRSLRNCSFSTQDLKNWKLGIPANNVKGIEFDAQYLPEELAASAEK